MSTSWYFHAVRATNEFGFTWRWQRGGAGGSLSECGAPFSYYYDCIEDARKHGFRGPLPAGPKVALDCLPKLPLPRRQPV